MGIFKSNDIRGFFGKDLTTDIVYRIGYYLPEMLGTDDILVGRDGRLSSPAILEALSNGITDAGCNVTDIGQCDTPAVYFATKFYDYDGSVMITASHNPPEDNGLKVSKTDVVPIGYQDGLNSIEEKIKTAPEPKGQKGTIKKLDIRKDYINHINSFAKGIEGLKVVLDCSNGAASFYVHDVLKELKGDFSLMYDVADGNFPNHGPNPTQPQNVKDLQEKVVKDGADLGVCFDGDADRAILIDEKGNFVSPDMTTALLGLHFYKHFPEKTATDKTLLYDLRSSKSVAEFAKKLGGKAEPCISGHRNIKRLLREKQGILAGELSGHYYFRDNFYCDSAFIAVIAIIAILSIEKKPLSELIAEINPYFFSGEINFEVKNMEKIIDVIDSKFPGCELNTLEGKRIAFDDWWFMIRPSGAEPLLRLVVEASTEESLKEKVNMLKNLIPELDD